MRKGYYYFRECGSIEKVLLITGIISVVLAFVFWFKGGYLSLISDEYYFTVNNAWFLFFLLISIFAFISDFCVHKICRDIATLLKEVEENAKH